MIKININNWFDNVVNAVTRSRDIVVAPIYESGDKSKKGLLTEPSWVRSPIHGVPRNIDFGDLEQYERDITVAASINFITDAVATTDWEIIGEGSNKEAQKFFEAGNWEVSFETVLRQLIPDILHYDAGTIIVSFPERCYDAQKNLITTAKPVKLSCKDGRSFMKKVDPFGEVLAYYQYSFANQGAKPVEFTPEEIVYLQERPSSRSPYGASKLEIVKNIADLMLAIQMGHRAEQENALQVGGIIGHPNINDPDRLKQLSTMYNSNLKGEANKKKWLITGGDVEVTPVDANTSDNTWIDGARYYQEAILSIFKVNRSILGMTTDVNRATSETQASNFKLNGVSAVMELIEKILTREIVKKYFGDNLEFRFKRELDLNDEKMRADIDATNIQSGINDSNELREDRGLKAIVKIEKGLKKDQEDEAVDDLTDWVSEYEKVITDGLKSL